MSERICPMVARGSWDVASAQQRDSWHRLCATQSPSGLKASATGGWLVFLSGSHRGEDARLPQGTITVGSAWTADLVLTGPDVGSQHASLVVGDGHAMISPLGASRDVRVNGERIGKDAVLADADLVSFGELHAVFRFAKIQQPGYRPPARQRPMVAPTFAQEARLFTAAWLVSLVQTRYGQDWRLIKGINRLGSALDIEVYWPDNAWPAHACTLTCAVESIVLSDLAPSLKMTVNGERATNGMSLRDSDRVRINEAEFYLKCL